MKELISNKIKRRVFNNNKKMFLAFLFYMTVAMILFYGYIYNDILETSRMGIAVWEEIFSGRIRNFYFDSFLMDPYGYEKEVIGGYDFPIYIIFAVWDLPLYLIHLVWKIDIFKNVFLLMWAKSILILFVILLLKEVRKMCLLLGLSEEDGWLCCSLILSSGFFVSSIIIIGGYDIIPIYFTLCGINYYLEEDNKNFLLMFAIAIPLKLFALFAFIPLLLLKIKNPLKIIGFSILPFISIVLFRILIPKMNIGNAGGALVSNDLGDISNIALVYATEYKGKLILGDIYYSVAAFTFLFACCYLVKLSTKEQYQKCVPYCCFASYSAYFLTSYSHPYWLITIVPFLMIVLVQNKKYLHVNLLLEVVMTCGLLTAEIFSFPWCYSNKVVCNLYWRLVFGIKLPIDEVNIISILKNRMGMEATTKISNAVTGAGSTVFLVCTLMFLIYNLPYMPETKVRLLHENEPAEEWVYILRFVTSLLIALIPIAIYNIWIKGV
jgi:hypothetical protein